METRDGDSFASFWPPTWSKCQRCLRHGPARTATFPWEKIGKNHTGITTNLQKVKPQYCDWILMSKNSRFTTKADFFFRFKTFWGRKSIFHRTLWQNLWKMPFDSVFFIDFSLTYCPFWFFFHGTGSSKGRHHTASVKSGWLCWRMAWLMSSKTLVCQQLFLCLKLFSRYLMFHHWIVYVFFSIKHNVTSIKYQSSIMPYGQVTELQYKLNSVFCDTKQSSLSCRTGSGTLNFDIETTFFLPIFKVVKCTPF